MLKESTFAWALSLSVLGHASLFILSPSHFHLHPAELFRPKTEDVEITYFEIRDVPQWGGLTQKASPQEVQEKKTEVLSPTPSISFPSASRGARSSGAIEIPKPKLVERSVPRQNSAEEKANLVKEKALYQEMASNLREPVFATYYQAIREKIRKAAKRRYGGKLDSGDVSLGFTLFSNGRLKEVSVLRQSSTAISNLRTLAVQSLVEASPFPPFPERLRRDQLSFLVVLTFEPRP